MRNLCRDIKPENILFTKDMVLKLADFGLAIDLGAERAVTRAGTLDYMVCARAVLDCLCGGGREGAEGGVRPHVLSVWEHLFLGRQVGFDGGEVENGGADRGRGGGHVLRVDSGGVGRRCVGRGKEVTHAGKPGYVVWSPPPCPCPQAPEVLQCPFKSHPEENKDKDRLHYSMGVDSWAVGVLTFELLVGVPPFYDPQHKSTETRIKASAPTIPAGLSEQSRDFILGALNKAPSRRLQIHQMLHHGWIEGFRAARSARMGPHASVAGAVALPARAN
eukprot:15404-Chlamydomonas_euryale.AAC.1